MHEASAASWKREIFPSVLVKYLSEDRQDIGLLTEVDVVNAIALMKKFVFGGSDPDRSSLWHDTKGHGKSRESA
jgi:hypothetical protein